MQPLDDDEIDRMFAKCPWPADDDKGNLIKGITLAVLAVMVAVCGFAMWWVW